MVEASDLTSPVWTPVSETILTDSWKLPLNPNNSFFRLSLP